MKKIALFALLFLIVPLAAEAVGTGQETSSYAPPCSRGDRMSFLGNGQFTCTPRRFSQPLQALRMRRTLRYQRTTPATIRAARPPKLTLDERTLERTFSLSPSFSRERARERIDVRNRRQFLRSYITITNTRDARREFVRRNIPHPSRSPLGRITTRLRRDLAKDIMLKHSTSRSRSR